MCEYCNNSKSLFWEENENNNSVREVYIELDGSMTVTTNLIDLVEGEENRKIGINHYPKASCNFKIKYCPMCGNPIKISEVE